MEIIKCRSTVFAVLGLVYLTSCSMGERTVSHPKPKDIIKSFSDVDAAIPVVTGALELYSFEGLLGNSRRLVFRHPSSEATTVAAALGIQPDDPAEHESIVPSVIDGTDYPWHFWMLTTNTADGLRNVVIEGHQMYN
jgi:hypothetical protein